jgi:hypothetical protein
MSEGLAAIIGITFAVDKPRSTGEYKANVLRKMYYAAGGIARKKQGRR